MCALDALKVFLRALTSRLAHFALSDSRSIERLAACSLPFVGSRPSNETKRRSRFVAARRMLEERKKHGSTFIALGSSNDVDDNDDNVEQTQERSQHDGGGDDKHRAAERNETDECNETDDDDDEKTAQKFGVYQLALFFLTQAGYLPVASSLLSSMLLEPSKVSKQLAACLPLVGRPAGAKTRNMQICRFQQFCVEYIRKFANDSSANAIRHERELAAVVSAGEFYSLLFEWRVACIESPQILRTTTSLMGKKEEKLDLRWKKVNLFCLH